MNLVRSKTLHPFQNLEIDLWQQNHENCSVYHQHMRYSENLCVVDMLGTLPIRSELYHDVVFAQSMQINLATNLNGDWGLEEHNGEYLRSKVL